MKTLLRRAFSFNLPHRDEWVAAQAARVPAGARVLDVGAGSCPYRPLFAHCEYRAHDFQQLQPGDLRGRKGYGHLDYVGDLCAIPVADASFDVILCTEVLEHVPEPIRAVKEFARIVKPGGKVLLTAPLGSGLHQEPYHFYGGYTPHWYRRFLHEAGFEDIQIEPNGDFFSFYGQESVRCAMLLAPWKGGARLFWLPVWCLGLPWCLCAPLLAPIWDRMDREKTFTVGYHVSARRR